MKLDCRPSNDTETSWLFPIALPGVTYPARVDHPGGAANGHFLSVYFSFSLPFSLFLYVQFEVKIRKEEPTKT